MIPHLCALFSAFAYLVASWGYTSAVFRRSQLTESRRQKLRAVLTAGLFAHVAFVAVTQSGAGAGIGVSAQLPAIISFVSCLLIGLFLLFEGRYQLGGLGALVAPVGFLLLLSSAVLFHRDQVAAQSTARGFLVSLHLTAMIVAYTLFVFAFCVSGAFLLQERMLKSKRGALNEVMFPSNAALDRFSRLLVGSGFAMLTVAIAVGISLAAMFDVGHEQLLVRLLWVAPVFLVYGTVVLLSFGYGFRGRRVAWITVFGFVSIVISFLGGRFAGGDFHVY